MSEHNMEPLSEKMEELEKKGFTSNFRVVDNQLIDSDSGKKYSAMEARLEYEYRTEGDTNPDDMSILFALTCEDGAKGLLVSSYGASSDTEAIEFVNQIDKTDTAKPEML